MKTNFSKIATFLILTITLMACSGSDNAAPVVPNTGAFTATINGEAYSSNDITYLSFQSESLLVNGPNSKNFTISIFPAQFPIGQDVQVAWSPTISYQADGKGYAPKSGTINFSILEPGKRLKATFSYVATDGTTDLTIVGQFDVTK